MPQRSKGLQLLALLVVLTTTSNAAEAADVSRLQDRHCDLTLSGQIDAGDAISIGSELKRLDKTYKRLCLDSQGGSFDEAINIIKLIMEETNIYTVIRPGAECYSACSLVFMFGNHNEGDAMISPHRELSVRGKLGFHTPHIDPAIDIRSAELSAKAYRAGIKAIGRLLEADWDDWFPKSLLIEALKREPHEFIFVDTVERAARWGIDLPDAAVPSTPTSAMLESACLNHARAQKNKWLMRWWGAGDSPTGQREEITSSDQPVKVRNKHARVVFKGFGSEDGFVCVVDLYDLGPERYVFDVHFGSSEKDPEIPKPQNPQQVAKDKVWNGPPNWYALKGATTLQEVALKQQK